MTKLIKFSSHAWLDYIHWQKSDKEMKQLIDKLCLSILETPYQGLGYPQPLSYELNQIWCRRINMEHRLVYRINKDQIEILQCRLHY
ncbi:Txe/YoeB family addiction module toxin [Reichenbachiella agarivorans]|uniref:Putative mRNA interferase YoeB n=1 Tax=Reichenbachiella agarivorans TaxID=2979464 RepID=A0ABY6CLV5_9BACT|nr:Txe/YoeB family addiction module toxin [Reichenbachiella agarivorans]UXP31494.1 Txe/YoeB family addiction module toxin [Reichenbachiella agarivorans]